MWLECGHHDKNSTWSRSVQETHERPGFKPYSILPRQQYEGWYDSCAVALRKCMHDGCRCVETAVCCSPVWYYDRSASFDPCALAGLNDASESLAKRTVYDKLYFFSHLFQPVMNLTKKKDVGPADLKNAFTQV